MQHERQWKEIIVKGKGTECNMKDILREMNATWKAMKGNECEVKGTECNMKKGKWMQHEMQWKDMKGQDDIMTSVDFRPRVLSHPQKLENSHF